MSLVQNSFASPVSSCLIKLHETLRTGLVRIIYWGGGGGGALRASSTVSEMVKKFVGSLNGKVVI